MPPSIHPFNMKVAPPLFAHFCKFMPGLVFWKDCHSIYQGVNQTFVQHMGLTEGDDMVGLSDFDLARRLQWLPTIAQKRREYDCEVMEQKKAITFEETIECVDHTVRTFLITQSPLFSEQQGVVGVIGIAQDITEYKKQQKILEIAKQHAETSQDLSIELSAVIRYAHGLIYWKDRHSVHLGCNDRFALLAGLPSPESVVGKTDYDLAWKEQAASFQKDDAEVIQSGLPKLHIEDRLPTAQGTIETVISNKVPLRDRYGNIVGVLGVATEITQLKQIQEQLRRALAQLAVTHQAEIKQALIDRTAQVSHDIRSPLAALNTAFRTLSALPEEQRILIRNAIGRMNDIANNLLIEYRGEKNEKQEGTVGSSTNERSSSRRQPELLSDILDTLLSEKKVQMMDRPLVFHLEVAESLLGVFVRVDTVQIKRVLSNLLNNAAEAIEGSGTITLQVLQGEAPDQVRIDIVDTGKGIPASVLERIQAGSVTHGKVGGTGIGIASAKTLSEEYGGSFTLVSQEGVGTTVSLILPMSPAPSWFQESLVLQPGMTWVVLDDDASIHSIWTTRCPPDVPHVTLKHLYHSDAFREYVASIQPKQGSFLFLMDFELLGSPETGLDLIESLGLQNQSILVTSRYEEPAVRERAARMSVKIIPKNFSPYIPIVVAPVEEKKPRLVFVDDDKTLTAAWEQAAQHQNLTIRTCNSTADLRKILPYLEKSTPIYIDSNLQEAVQGEVFAKELYDQGFTELYLASGHPRGYFGALPWIKAFVEKEPPF